MADHLTWKTCSLNNSPCDTSAQEKQCTISGGTCTPSIDAYYIEVTLCTLVGILWLLWKYRKLKSLQNLPLSKWQVRNRRRSELLEDEDDDESSSKITA
jgi:PAT family acetyl-CoA transporter-like MFS transporter 1